MPDHTGDQGYDYRADVAAAIGTMTGVVEDLSTLPDEASDRETYEAAVLSGMTTDSVMVASALLAVCESIDRLTEAVESHAEAPTKH